MYISHKMFSFIQQQQNPNVVMWHAWPKISGHVMDIHVCKYFGLNMSKLFSLYFHRFFLHWRYHELKFDLYSLLNWLLHWICVVLDFGEKCHRSLQHIFHTKQRATWSYLLTNYHQLLISWLAKHCQNEAPSTRLPFFIFLCDHT